MIGHARVLSKVEVGSTAEDGALSEAREVTRDPTRWGSATIGRRCQREDATVSAPRGAWYHKSAGASRWREALLGAKFNSAKESGRADDALKRLLDVVVATLGIVGSAPLLVLLAGAIKLTSRGPVLYRARRAGVDGAAFDVLKLRTMTADADRQGTITVGGDARITPIGKFLRSTKLDELPQLWNILRGEMSLVGPRPESLNIVEEHFTAEHREVLRVRPGLTCTGNLYYYLYQEHLSPPVGVSGEEFYVRYLLDDKIAADLHYVRHRTLVYDIRLLWETVWVMSLKLLGGRPRWTPPIPLPINPLASPTKEASSGEDS